MNLTRKALPSLIGMTIISNPLHKALEPNVRKITGITDHVIQTAHDGCTSSISISIFLKEVNSGFITIQSNA